MATPLNPHEATIRGIRLPRILAVLKYWIDELRNGILDYKIVSNGLNRFKVERKNCLFELDHVQRLFCRTRGLSSYFFHWRETLKNKKPFQFSRATNGLLERSINADPQIVKKLNKDGYFLSFEKAPESIVESLRAVAFDAKCYPRLPKGHSGSTAEEAFRENISPVYDYKIKDLVKYPIVQQLISDTSIIRIAQDYLKCQPILDLVAMWWSLPTNGEAFIEGAQAYHFDMDRFRWVKFFIYLEDVGPENGPHCFIKGTHRPFSIPWDILKYNYERHDDAYVSNYYNKDRFVEFTGKKGTILIEDTRGLHKGRPLKSGRRLMFELEFTGSLFGALIEPTELKYDPKSEFGQFVEKYPRIYERFDCRRT